MSSPASAEASLNGDLSLRVVVRTAEMEWAVSPSGSVWRKRLHRVGSSESGQVTSLVRFEAGAEFPEHGHPDGEEIFVLDGTFSDEAGSWGPGWYLASPEGTSHAPRSSPGCLLFVKLQQYGGEGRPEVRLDSGGLEWLPTDDDGVVQRLLFADDRFPEVTRLERWAAGSSVTRRHPRGAELFVVEGGLVEGGEKLDPGCWLRLPAGATLNATSVAGCLLLVKDGGVAALCGDPA